MSGHVVVEPHGFSYLSLSVMPLQYVVMRKMEEGFLHWFRYDFLRDSIDWRLSHYESFSVDMEEIFWWSEGLSKLFAEGVSIWAIANSTPVSGQSNYTSWSLLFACISGINVPCVGGAWSQMWQIHRFCVFFLDQVFKGVLAEVFYEIDGKVVVHVIVVHSCPSSLHSALLASFLIPAVCTM